MHRATQLALLILLPGGLAAQGVSITPYTARNGALPGAPALVGLSATGWSGPVGVRLGGAMDLPSSPVAPLLGHPPADATAAWHGELDLVLGMGRAGLGLGGIEPALFTGFGVHGRRLSDGSTATIPVWSYGGGAGVLLTPWLGLDLEARYRMPHESDASRLPQGIGGGWETRLGLAIHLGRRRGGSGGAARPATRRAGSPAPGSAGGSTIRIGSPRAGEESRRDASAAAVARRTLDTADRYVGVPYRWGGNTPSEGFDCSGFVRYVFAQQGITLPRVSRDQARAGEWLPPRLESLAPGDLMFYAGSNGVVDHVAIYAGDNRIIHSSSSGRGVRYDDLGSRRGRYYATRMVAARRVIPDGTFFLGWEE